MKKIFHLSTCSTCQRILKEIKPSSEFRFQDIKKEKIEEKDLDRMIQLAGNVSALFSKSAQKYKELGLKDKNLSDQEMRNYILTEYTFLKRPVLLDGDKIFIGNSAKVIEEVKSHLGQ